jgi:2-polyprenyl-6-hydroxyphenyl methylase/3-demethylubiquinone-9 3-methyltransferase
MAEPAKATQLESHFAFGRNWEAFARLIDPARIARAEASLLEFLAPAQLRGARVLDIGCGSGLFTLAALRLGARQVTAIDIDSDSVATTCRLLQAAAPDRAWQAQAVSLFDLDPAAAGPFDVVYAWGVLHHTGDMWRAVDRAGRFVGPGGLLLLALYRRTALCPFWAWEKRRFAHGSDGFRRLARALYRAAFVARLLATGQSPGRFFAAYKQNRGMDWTHDSEDWLGGYPYESATFEEVRRYLAERHFEVVKSKVWPRRLGLFGSGCDEYLFRRRVEAG